MKEFRAGGLRWVTEGGDFPSQYEHILRVISTPPGCLFVYRERRLRRESLWEFGKRVFTGRRNEH